jgi:hypothetical protein
MLDVTTLQQRYARTPPFHGFGSWGVLTAADATFFPGLQVLTASLGEAVPLAIIDLGLTDDQRAWCASQKSQLIRPAVLRMPRDVTMWQAWNKPFYYTASPFRQTVWIDSDCAVVGDLRVLFFELEMGPFVVRHWDVPYPQPNREALYQRFPVSLRLPPGDGINSGVIGLDQIRDADLLEAWCNLVDRAAEDPTIRSCISWYDDGALQWAFEATRRLDRVLPRHAWNRFVPSRLTDDPVAYIVSIGGESTT